MPKKSEIPIKKFLINYFIGDMETLAQFYPQLGYSVAARNIIHQHCKLLRERASREGLIITNVGPEPDISAILGSLVVDATIDATPGAGGSELDGGSE